MKMYRYIRSILKNVIDSQGSCFDEKLKIDLTTVHIVFNYIETQQAEIYQLKADRLEMAEALVMQVEQANYCVECDQWASHGIEHKKDCTVLKAQQIIKESK